MNDLGGTPRLTGESDFKPDFKPDSKATSRPDAASIAKPDGKPSGKVWLVGAGPGDPDLLTVKAARILRQAEVWLVDDLVGPDIRALAAPGARIVNVGKRGGCRSTPQDFILRLMARHARQGRMVARVKGGDPFIFGRGGEEMHWLAARGLAAEAVGGITAGLAVGAALGLPLTHRGVSRGVALVTAHTMDDSRPDWRALAASGLTLVCYMGMRDAGTLARELREAGFAADMPVAVAQRVSCPEQRHIVTRLDRMAADIADAGMASPAVIVIGQAVALIESVPRHASLTLAA
ncbi:uroporphyrinogen-III C-methyltransferase [Bordetella genomosp. 8]|uniref:uroporphyrinogen-III C-methyltransferase n=1 Tax=Bordetella genomosp. 8 TaxID=1416806 RepID=A0A1W6YHS5_9BORD|nr:uroporphyrinogen-III C-methyltransferase [Bordetella genomosp. 8]ARP80610.1 uroporphyrinogen-III C-methyltransferase [Bordetella genomosp. 8]